MRERPILFSGPMVRAILSGQKTQTRRIVKPQPDIAQPGPIPGAGICAITTPDDQRLGRLGKIVPCPYGQPGDRLWVRETWAHGIHALAAQREEDGPFVYAADNHGTQGRLGDRWRPSIHMPRPDSRITLEIISVRVQRLQDISEADCIAEGIQQHGEKQGWVTEARFPDGKRHFGAGAYGLFQQLWQSINGADSWAANPWVWAVEFRRITQ